MKTNRKFTIVFADGTQKSGLTFDEADKVMEQSENTDNEWTRAYPEPTEYKAP